MKNFADLDLSSFMYSYQNVMDDDYTRLMCCPKKTSLHINRKNGIDTEYMNVMPARLDYDSSISFVKTIYVNLESNKKTIEDLLYIEDGKVIRKHNIGLTPYRCGMLSCMILNYLMYNNNELGIHKVGFIGTGNINYTIAKLIKKWIPWITNFGIQNRSHNSNVFDDFNSILKTDYDISNCDVIFSCTNNVSDKTYSESEVNHAKCLVSFDGGCVFDPSTRLNRTIISDHVEQLKDVYVTEFPNDNFLPKRILQLTSHNVKYANDKMFINIYGTAYADLLVFRQLIEEEDFNV